jgi:predicted Zn finger-like uncharacterized protein
MFTRCPSCQTVFHITAAELKAADGTVICGACDATFDALDSLSETRPDDGTGPVAEDTPEEPGRKEEDAAESARDEDEFLEEIESLIGSEESDGEAPVIPDTPLQGQPGAGTDGPGDYGDEDLDQIPDPDSVFRVDDLPDEYLAGMGAPFVGDDQAPQADDRPAGERQRSSTADEANTPDAISLPRDDAVSKGADTDASDSEAAENLPGFIQEIRRGVPWLKVTATAAALLVLAGTWAHVQRGKLLREPAGEAVLGPIYGALRIEANPDWKPGDFRVLRSEAIADADYRGDLRVAVEFLNGAAFAQPYPVIRIVLQDRFGRRIGMHDIAPERYLESYSNSARLAAGERIQTSVAVPDPGERAEGFRVDLCLETATRGLVCAPEPFR